VYFFATNIEADENANINDFGQLRINITKEVFNDLKIIDIK